MASKFLFFHLLLALVLHFSNISAAQLGACYGPPTIHIISKMSGMSSVRLSVSIKAGGSFKGSAELSCEQDYQIKVDVNDVYYASALYGLKFTSFHAYEPARDKGQAAVYWKADAWGFHISYNKTSWRRVAPWESE